MRGEDGSGFDHPYDSPAAYGPGYDAGLALPRADVHPGDYGDPHQYQDALAAAHNVEEAAVAELLREQDRRRAANRRTPCDRCGPPRRTFAEVVERRELCPRCAQLRDAETRLKVSKYTALHPVDDALFAKFIRGLAPHVVDGETHHFYDWSGERVASFLPPVLSEPLRFRDALFHLGQSVYLMPSGAVATVGLPVDGDLGELTHPGGKLYIVGRPRDRFNSRAWTMRSSPHTFDHAAMNYLPKMIADYNRGIQETKRREAQEAEARRIDEQEERSAQARATVTICLLITLVLALILWLIL